MTRYSTACHQRGFTLIELSIVLVIIGLITGGVLLGRDLISAAEIRATAKQYEKYNSSVNTFREKYGNLPGDFPYTQASAFGFFTFTGSNAGLRGFGDGNGLVESGGGGSAPTGETLVFWRHLGEAQLIEGSFGSSLLTTSGQAVPGIAVAFPPDVVKAMPASRIGRGNYFIAYSTGGYDYYHLMPITGITGLIYTGGTTGASGLTPVEAYNLDQKLDDGLPNGGIITAREVTSPPLDIAASWAATPTNGKCISGGASAADLQDIYNVGDPSGKTFSCSIKLRFQ